MFSAGKGKSTEVIGAYTSYVLNNGANRRTVNLSYQVELTTGWFAGSVIIVEEGKD